MCSLEDIVVWILISFNNCKRQCTSPVKFYTNTFATDVSIIVSVNFWASLLNSTVITTNTFSQNLGLFQGTESMLSLIHFNVFIMPGPFFCRQDCNIYGICILCELKGACIATWLLGVATWVNLKTSVGVYLFQSTAIQRWVNYVSTLTCSPF